MARSGSLDVMAATRSAATTKRCSATDGVVTRVDEADTGGIGVEIGGTDAVDRSDLLDALCAWPSSRFRSKRALCLAWLFRRRILGERLLSPRPMGPPPHQCTSVVSR